jgi:hypothetical protein
LLGELAELYRQVDQRYLAHRCERTTECCRFGITGREPYLTSVELLAIRVAQAAAGGPLPPRRRARPLDPVARDEGICPLLARDGGCSVYAVRPLGCRTYWCRRAAAFDSVEHREVTQFVRALQSLASRHAPGGDQGRPLRRALLKLAPRR